MALNELFDKDDPDGIRHTFSPRAPSYIDARFLAATTNEAHTIPTGARIVVFSAEADFWARPDATAAIPSADVTDGSGSQLNPANWNIEANTTINVISATAQTVCLTFYS